MPHRRSPKAMSKRLARRILHSTSFHDPELAETVARTNITYRDRIGNQDFKVSVEHGEILRDNRARGTEQKIMTEVKPRLC